MKKSDQPIGVFDSGIGGLSILTELKKQLPNENFVFLADQEYIPYGEKTKAQLVKRVKILADYLIETHNIKILVVACNTATANTIEALRSAYDLPIVGTIPAVKVAARNTRSKVIAVLSTPSTSKSPALKKLIKENCRGIQVINIGAKGLVDFVEKGETSSPKLKKLLKKYLLPVRNSKADQLVLGCTHYPFLKKSIKEILGPKVKIIDSGAAIAKRAKTLLVRGKIQNKSSKKGKTEYITTKE